jgi:hypothetical protein
MANFGGTKDAFEWQAKGAAFYGLTDDDLRLAWERYHQGYSAHVVVSWLKPRCWTGHRMSLKKLVVEWGAMGLEVWVFGRRGKIRRGAQRLLRDLQERFDMPLTPTIYAALKFAEAQGADLRGMVEHEFGAAPKRPRYWYNRDARSREILQYARAARGGVDRGAATGDEADPVSNCG